MRQKGLRNKMAPNGNYHTAFLIALFTNKTLSLILLNKEKKIQVDGVRIET